MTLRQRSVSSSSYSSYTSESDSDDERYYGNPGAYGAGTLGANTGAYSSVGTTGVLPTQVVQTGQVYQTSNVLPTQGYQTGQAYQTQGQGQYPPEVVTNNVDINHSQHPLIIQQQQQQMVQPVTTVKTYETVSQAPVVVNPVVQSTTVVTTENVPTANRAVPLQQAENVALAQSGVEERLKGRGSRIRNKIRLRRHNKEIKNLASGVGAMEIVDRSKFNGYGPVDQLDQKLAGRNAIDNAIAENKGDADYNVGGYPAMESYRQNPDNIMRHKFTGQTHFDTENASTGPGFTNGDFYDKPGYAGTKHGQAKHQGPIDALAQKIVGHHYTTHEPMMDKIYVEPQQKGPIDALAHMLTGGHHAVVADGAGTTGVGVVGAQTGMQKLKGRLHRHHRHKKGGVVAGDPYSSGVTTGQHLPKEMGEGPIDALAHKLTFSLHDPLHTKTAGAGLHNEIIPAGVVNAGQGAGISTGVEGEHVGMMQKLKNKLHH